MAEVTTRSDELRRRAQAVFGGGSLFMYDLPEEANVVLERGAGARAWDVDGREWVDYHLGSGPLLIGHAHPAVVAAVHGAELAAIIVEPMQRAFRPSPGFLEGLRRLATASGALLVFDEIVTGFRLARGGAQERYGVVPDMCTLGKAIGGGYPVAAVAGPREVMAVTAGRRRGREPYAWVSGTLNGNPLGAAAGLATLEVLARPGAYERLHELGDRLRAGLMAAGRAAGLPLWAVGDGPLCQVFFASAEPRCYADALASDGDLRRRFG